MSKVSGASGARSIAPVTVSFGDRLAASEQFDRVFKEGMALVERTAAYLDGEGRRAQRGLAPSISVSYATESMRLTTRLLELASWLLIKRALRDGEITPEEANRKRAHIKLAGEGRASHVRGFDALPAGLRELIVESFALHDRIVQLDRALSDRLPSAGTSPVAVQIERLERAFGTIARRG